MSGQYGLTKEQQDKILKVLEEARVDTEAQEKELSPDGKFRPFHRDISISVCRYDDETEEYNMHIQVD